MRKRLHKAVFERTIKRTQLQKNAFERMFVGAVISSVGGAIIGTTFNSVVLGVITSGLFIIAASFYILSKFIDTLNTQPPR